MENSGLNEPHRDILKSYMQFTKYERNRNMKFLDMPFQDVTNARLVEGTLTREEVKELLDNLKDLVQGEVEAELMEMSRTNVFLITQLLVQAEKSQITMSLDFSNMQNRELLERALTADGSGDEEVVESSTDPSIEHLTTQLEALRTEKDNLESDMSKELERKFNQTAAYANMKMIINRKNEQVKQLRRELLEYQMQSNSIEK